MRSGTPMGRPKRVRTRLVAGVLVSGIVVIAAGTPALLHASAQLDDAQRSLTLARLGRQAVSLSRSLADERDQAVVFVAAGRPAKGTKRDGNGKAGDDDSLQAAGDRVDQQITEIHAALAGSSVPASFSTPLKDIGEIPAIRRTALTGKGSAIAAYTSYSQVITSLHRLTEQLADRAPASAAPGARADAALDRAVDQASATRGLLLGALSVPADKPTINPLTGLPMEGSDSATADGRARDALSAAAQLARVRELAALDDFDAAADAAERTSFMDTVTGPDVKSAEDSLGKLTAGPQLSSADLDTDPDKLNTALTARIDQMRGAESALAAEGLKGFGKDRDDAVRDLELRAALAAGCLLVVVAVSTSVARTLTRPLAAVRRGAARVADAPATAEPVRFTGRNDEFADVVRSLNALHSTVLALTGRAATAPGGTGAAVATGATASGSGISTLSPAAHATTGAALPPATDDEGVGGGRAAGDPGDAAEARVRAAEAAAVSALTAEERAALQAQIDEVAGDLRRMRHSVRHTFVNLSLRNLGLVERQLGVIESLEESEQDPERLATLYKLDHMATVMRRHSENLLVLAEHEQSHAHAGPVPLVDVLRAAVSEIERYERITIQTLPPHAQVAGYAADDLSHLVAELLENAASFSPPDASVELSGWLLETGEVMLSVVDQGIGVADDRLEALNGRLAATTADPAAADGRGGNPTEGLGLRVIALLAARHGVRVELRRQQQDGGVTAVVIVPQQLMPSEPPAVSEVGTGPAGGSGMTLPGSVAEANSHVLPVRPGAAGPHDPLIAAAEASVRAAERAGTIIPAHAGGDLAPEAGDALPGSVGAAQPAGAGAPRVPGARLPEPRRPRSAASASDPYAIGPDSHERAAGDETGDLDSDTFTMRLPGPPAPAGRGLPKRVPKEVRTAGAPLVRKRVVDPEELRRRLGGFHQGAKAGRHDAEEEIRGSAGARAVPEGQPDGQSVGQSQNESPYGQQPYRQASFGQSPFDRSPFGPSGSVPGIPQGYGQQAYGQAQDPAGPAGPHPDGTHDQRHQDQRHQHGQQDENTPQQHAERHQNDQQHRETQQHPASQRHTEAAGETVEEAHR
ncbi:sensor histidine kinase [Streptomyces sp. NBC_01497]|uniref:sensor histidine kinase n=1 Tax=Streptomyces sp. NBC_01497 TaxID=2903885 RepID=UPI002E319801|nr:nitrate- and nitrite sensing domain-containing protein [Streptomyces sp. NBC_01497]